MRPTQFLCVLAAVASTAATISSHAQAVPAFEVASVKPNVSGTDGGSSNGGPNTFTAVNMSLRRLIGIAYRIDLPLVRERIVGPSLIDSSRYDITARIPNGSDGSQTAEMLRTLLAERFALTAHVEMRTQSGYALVRARKDQLGPQLMRSTVDCSNLDPSVRMSPGAMIKSETPLCGMASTVDATGGVLRGGARTMTELARNLTGQVRRTVVDKTGLSGAFDFVLRWTPENFQTVTAASGPSTDGTLIFTALQEQLGLKLEEERVPVEFLIIDKVERPTPD
jgi:uncharacterized protein (TIGR03435 family)